MPAYDYKCPKCGYKDTYYLPMEHKAPKHCKQDMERIYSEMNFILKGEGWAFQGYDKPNALMQKQNG